MSRVAGVGASASGPGHQRSSSSTSNAASGSGNGSAGSYRYKAITREVLLAVCRKHFALKTTGGSSAGRSFKGGSQLAKMEYAAQHGEGYDYSSSEPQTKLETLERYLKRATHLQLDGLKLTHTFPSAELAAQAGQNPLDQVFAQAKNIRVLYLHANYLSTLDDFSFCAATLSHLYLQNNNIARMENLLQLTNLEKLYIGGNQIQLLEGFAPEVAEEQQQNGDGGEQQHDAGGGGGSRHAAPPPFYLVELHMDGQSLPPNQSLQLSIPSIQALSSTLTILSLSHNQMDSDSILPISLLSRLTDLNLSHNRVDDLKVVAEMCSYLRDLGKLDLRENPINSGAGHTAVTHKKYRDRVIMSSARIAVLDDKPVLDNQRDYLHGLMEQRRIKRAQAAAAAGKPRELSEEERKFAALHAPPAFPYAPKVLTLRTTPIGGGGAGGPGANSINVGMLGGMGAGARHTLHGSASSASFAGQGAAHQSQFDQYQPQQSPFLDDDDNLGGGAGGGGRGGDVGFEHQSQFDPSQQGQQPSGAPNGEGTASSMTFTGDPARLNDLLQQRGLVSAFTGMAINSAAPPAAATTTAESARVRRASMNSLNQAPKGWDGGRTQHAPPVLGRKPSQTGSGGSSASSSATPSRTATRSSASKSSVAK